MDQVVDFYELQEKDLNWKRESLSIIGVEYYLRLLESTKKLLSHPSWYKGSCCCKSCRYR